MKDKIDKAACREALEVVRAGLKDVFTQLRMYNMRIRGDVHLSIIRQAIVRACVVGLLA